MHTRRRSNRGDKVTVTRKVHNSEGNEGIKENSDERGIPLEEMTVQVLKNEAKDKNITGYSTMKKEELIQALAGD